MFKIKVAKGTKENSLTSNNIVLRRTITMTKSSYKGKCFFLGPKPQGPTKLESGKWIKSNLKIILLDRALITDYLLYKVWSGNQYLSIQVFSKF